MKHGWCVSVWVASSIVGTLASRWSDWGSWTKCSKTDKQGMKYRHRHCQIESFSTSGCHGTSSQAQDCQAVGSGSTPTSTTNATLVSAFGDCYDPKYPESYRGPISHTETGVRCQAWKRQVPHPHKFTPEAYPWSGLVKNRCRNPDMDIKPWCFTAKRKTQWDYCRVPRCSAIYVTSSPPGSVRPPIVATDCGVPAEPMHDNEMPQGIVGGKETTPGSIPWQASLRWRHWRMHLCGGSLLAERWIISAAHCIAEPDVPVPSDYYVILGDHRQLVRDETEQRANFVAIYCHEEFDRLSLENDIVLMKMASSVSYNTYIRPICLPPAYSILVENETVTVSGWGETKEPEKNKVLRQTSVPVVSNSICEELLFNIAPTMMCAGYEEGGKDSCQGDSGGPLFYKSSNGRYQLVGIVSWGYGCAEPRKPGVYTRVSYYIPWINKKMLMM